MGQPFNEQSKANESLVNQLKEYEIIKPLGRGGMGIVYLVRHKLTHRTEVLKILRPTLANRPKLRERFLREVQIAARLDHPNVVKTYTAIQKGELLGLVMEYVDGMDLETMVRRSGPLRIAAATAIIRQAALGLQHAAERGLIHRDIKPSNILVSRSEGQLIAKLSDFGLSKLLEEPGDNGLTIEGRFLGTPDYMAPEQGLDAASATMAADIYGLGCSLFFALTGSPPYKGANALAVLNAHVSSPIPDVRKFRDDIPTELSNALAMMLQKDPRDRIASPAQVAKILQSIVLNRAPTSETQVTRFECETTANDTASGGLRIDVDTSSHSPLSYPDRKSRKPAGIRKKSAQSLLSTLLQVGIPLIFLVFGLLFFEPWNRWHVSGNGTLVLRELTAGTSVEIDGAAKVHASSVEEAACEIQLSPGSHRLRFLHGQEEIAVKTIEIKSNAKVELSASFIGFANRRDSKPRNITPPSPSRKSEDKLGNEPTWPVPNSSASANSNLGEPVEDLRIKNDSAETKSATPPHFLVDGTQELRDDQGKWKLDTDRSLSGLDTEARILTVIPRDITVKGNEIIVALAPKVQAWDAKSGFPVAFQVPFATVRGITVASNEKSAMYYDEYRCEVWAMQKLKYQVWFKGFEDEGVKRCYSMSADCKWLGCCDFNQSFSRWNLQTRTVESTMSARQPIAKDHVEAIALTARLDNAVVLANDGALTCWDTAKGETLGAAEPVSIDGAPLSRIIGFHVNSGANKVFTISQRGVLEVRKLPILELIDRFALPAADVRATAVSNKLLACASSDGIVSLIDVVEGSLAGILQPPKDRTVTGLAIATDSKFVVIGYEDGSINVVKLRKTQQTSPGPDDGSAAAIEGSNGK